ncbi:hypothetical protein NP233_g4023 [Leucocoprinus birnbaumii]|uniref:Uncharacterized protein n=1 Tax=Leucocoprinus birnbaumii TaxID=56174 RepID=A0AAD5VVG9_9AGAR|nr:hypothetical protein NP233_g4023 [Leucocoprinus birnbaumii]
MGPQQAWQPQHFSHSPNLPPQNGSSSSTPSPILSGAMTGPGFGRGMDLDAQNALGHPQIMDHNPHCESLSPEARAAVARTVDQPHRQQGPPLGFPSPSHPALQQQPAYTYSPQKAYQTLPSSAVLYTPPRTDLDMRPPQSASASSSFSSKGKGRATEQEMIQEHYLEQQQTLTKRLLEAGIADHAIDTINLFDESIVEVLEELLEIIRLQEARIANLETRMSRLNETIVNLREAASMTAPTNSITRSRGELSIFSSSRKRPRSGSSSSDAPPPLRYTTVTSSWAHSTPAFGDSGKSSATAPPGSKTSTSTVSTTLSTGQKPTKMPASAVTEVPPLLNKRITRPFPIRNRLSVDSVGARDPTMISHRKKLADRGGPRRKRRRTPSSSETKAGDAIMAEPLSTQGEDVVLPPGILHGT